jgi:hypothetical protein
MPDKKGLSFEQHQEVARELRKAIERLRKISVTIINAYGEDHAIIKLCVKLCLRGGYLDRLRHSLDKQFLEEFPGPAERKTPYYSSEVEEVPTAQLQQAPQAAEGKTAKS